LYREAATLFASLEVLRLPGGHHLHLEGGEAAIGAALRRFLDL
jgi:hypothetical protein